MRTPIELSSRALERATSDPAAGALADKALEAARAARDFAAEAIALRALGLVTMRGNDLGRAADYFGAAIETAEAHGLATLAAEARMSLAPVLAMTGDGRGALAACDRAAAALSGVRRARVEAQRAALLKYQGRADDALGAFDRAIPVLHRANDRMWEARARNNRGVLHHERGDLRAARADLLASEALAHDLGAEPLQLTAHHHLGLVEAGRGDLPAALQCFARADELAARIGASDPRGLIDRAAVLLPARLGEEARAAAESAIRQLARSGNEAYLAEAHRVHAEACLLVLDPAAAAESAFKAEQLFRHQHRWRDAALVGAAAVRSRWLAGERTPEFLEAARRSATTLERRALLDTALDARVVAAELATALGHSQSARRQLAAALRLPVPRTAAGRVRRHHARALACMLADDRRGADAALRAGLRVLDQHRATLGATELRARAAGHGQELARLGLRLAVEDRTAIRAFDWAERWHAASIQLTPVRPPGNASLGRDLAALRAVTLELEAAMTDGRDAASLWRRQAALEAAINRRVRVTRGRSATSTGSSVREVTAALGEAVLVELFADGDDVWAVVVGGGDRTPAVLQRLGSDTAMRREIDSVRFSLRRLAGGRSPASIDAALASLRASGSALDRIVVDPIRARLEDRPLVIVPTGAAHALPWSVLPSFRGRPVTVAPSATAWLRATRRPTTSGQRRTVLVAGPRLAGARREVRRLRKDYPTATVLVGKEAASASVLRAIDGAHLAHVAAHGTFRADNPLFSALELHDGPLTVHDLEGLRRPPEVLVLPSCDSGLSSVHPGDELIGLAASVLALGTRTVVASLLPVPDDTTLDVMVAFHADLRRGATPAEALAMAQAAAWAHADADGRRLAAAASLACFGGG